MTTEIKKKSQKDDRKPWGTGQKGTALALERDDDEENIFGIYGDPRSPVSPSTSHHFPKEELKDEDQNLCDDEITVEPSESFSSSEGHSSIHKDDCNCPLCLMLFCPHCKTLERQLRFKRAMKARRRKIGLAHHSYHHVRPEAEECQLCFVKMFTRNLRMQRIRILTGSLPRTNDPEDQLRSQSPGGFWQTSGDIFGLITKLCYLFCCPPIPSYSINKMAFAPQRVTYHFVDSIGKPIHKLKRRHENELDLMVRMNNGNELIDNGKPPIPNGLRRLEPFVAVNSHGAALACCLIRSRFKPQPPHAGFTLLHSHQNAVQIGDILKRSIWEPDYVQVADYLRSDICIYDYSGYGISSSSPREERMYADIQAVYWTLLNRFQVQPNRIVLWGYSLGVPAAIDLASRLHPTQLGGVVLAAGFISAFGVLRVHSEDKDDSLTWAQKNELADRIVDDHKRRNGKKPCCADQFYSLSKVERLTAPTLFVHGTKDGMMSTAHSLAMFRLCKGARNVQPLWIAEAGHNTIDFYEEYWGGLRCFLGRLKGRKSKRRRSQSSSETPVGSMVDDDDRNN